VLLSHLSKLRKVQSAAVEYSDNSRWVSVDDEDHFFFALLYAFTARTIHGGDSRPMIVLPSSVASTVRMPNGPATSA